MLKKDRIKYELQLPFVLQPERILAACCFVFACCGYDTPQAVISVLIRIYHTLDFPIK